MAFSPLPNSLEEALKEVKMWREKFKSHPAKQEQGEPVAREWPIMGYGNVAIGGGRNKEDGMSCLVYLKLDESREINADTTDVFPVGKEAPQDKLLACVYFKDGAAMQQTIEVLQEMQAEIGYTTPQQRKPLMDEMIVAWYIREKDVVTIDKKFALANPEMCEPLILGDS